MPPLLPHTELPFVRADGRGYVSGSESVEGFGDRPDLAVAARLRIARMAETYTPEGVTGVQRALLTAGTPKKVDVDLLQAIADDEALLSGPYLSSFAGLLSDDQKRLAADPSSHPKLEGVSYPLRIEQAAKLVGVTVKQLHHWDNTKVVRAYRVGGQRRYFRGMVLLAMAVKKLPAVDKTLLHKLLSGQVAPVFSIAAASSMAAGEETACKLFEEFSHTSAILRIALGDSFLTEDVRVIQRGESEWEVAEIAAAPRSLGVFVTEKKALACARDAARKIGTGRLEVRNADGSVAVTENVFA